MDLDWSHLVIAVLVGIIAASPQLYQAWRSRKKTDAETGKVDAEAMRVDADAAQVLTAIAMDMVATWGKRVNAVEAELEQLRETIAKLASRVRTLEEENKELWRGATRLANQVMELNEVPIWLPGDGFGAYPPR